MNLLIVKIQITMNMYNGYAYSKFIWSQFFSTYIKNYILKV